MKKLLILPFVLIVWTADCAGQSAAENYSKGYAIADLPTPVFNTPDFPTIFGGSDGKTLRMTSCQQIKGLEFIALPRTAFRVEDTVKKGDIVVYKVMTGDYPSPKSLFIDSRFVKLTEDKPLERPRELPPQQKIIDALISAKGSAYVWGGNIRDGVPETLSLYPPSSDLNPELKDRWTLKGLDCSGLLYEATDGYTPRNTDALIDFGRAVHIGGLNVSAIAEQVRPLDLITWEGHVIIILDRERTIESRLAYGREEDGCRGGGVRIRPLREVLEETLKSKAPVNSYTDEVEKGKKKFVIRRWYP